MSDLVRSGPSAEFCTHGHAGRYHRRTLTELHRERAILSSATSGNKTRQNSPARTGARPWCLHGVVQAEAAGPLAHL